MELEEMKEGEEGGGGGVGEADLDEVLLLTNIRSWNRSSHYCSSLSF